MARLVQAINGIAAQLEDHLKAKAVLAAAKARFDVTLREEELEFTAIRAQGAGGGADPQGQGDDPPQRGIGLGDEAQRQAEAAAGLVDHRLALQSPGDVGTRQQRQRRDRALEELIRRGIAQRRQPDHP